MIIVNIYFCCKLSIVIILNRIKLIYIAEMDCNMLMIKNKVVELIIHLKNAQKKLGYIMISN